MRPIVAENKFCLLLGGPRHRRQIELHTTVFGAVVWGDMTQMCCTAKIELSLHQGKRTDKVLKRPCTYVFVTS